MAAAIEFLRAQPGEAWLVLGDMGELGPDAERLHADAGTAARDTGIDRLFCTGSLSQATVDAFGAGAQWFENIDDLHASLSADVHAGCNVLVKASRFMGLDRLVRKLEPAETAGSGTGG